MQKHGGVYYELRNHTEMCQCKSLQHKILQLYTALILKITLVPRHSMMEKYNNLNAVFQVLTFNSEDLLVNVPL